MRGALVCKVSRAAVAERTALFPARRLFLEKTKAWPRRPQLVSGKGGDERRHFFRAQPRDGLFKFDCHAAANAVTDTQQRRTHRAPAACDS